MEVGGKGGGKGRILYSGEKIIELNQIKLKRKERNLELTSWVTVV